MALHLGDGRGGCPFEMVVVARHQHREQIFDPAGIKGFECFRSHAVAEIVPARDQNPVSVAEKIGGEIFAADACERVRHEYRKGECWRFLMILRHAHEIILNLRWASPPSFFSNRDHSIC